MAKPLPVRATLLLLAALAFADGARAAAPAQYEHDAAGRRVALKLPNGVKTTYAHDAAGRLTRIESKNAAGNVIIAFGYALDATGNRTAMDVTLNGTVNHIAYEFDDAYRLTRETRKDAAGQTLYDEGLTYDPVGNRLTRNRTQIAAVNGAAQSVTENTVYAYNAANQLLTETTNGVTTAYGYDKNGNNTTISTPAANGAPAKNITMTYDWLNRQTKWTDGERTESTVFAGADWKRASTTVTMDANGAAASPSIVKYLYDGDNVLADFSNDNALTAFYVTPGLDQNLSITDASGQTAYYTQDGLGSVRTLTAVNGAVLNLYDYTAFGEPFAPNTSATIPNRYTYTAREQSPLAAHGAPMYYRWRDYAPQIGRFGRRDPIGYEGGVNVYGYVNNDTLTLFDPLGLSPMDIIYCWAECVEDNDPIDIAVNKAIMLVSGMLLPKSFVAYLADSVGQAKLADKIRYSARGMGSKFTTIPSSVSLALRKGGHSTLRLLGRYASPAVVTYGLAMAAIETNCMSHCIASCGKYTPPIVLNIAQYF